MRNISEPNKFFTARWTTQQRSVLWPYPIVAQIFHCYYSKRWTVIWAKVVRYFISLVFFFPRHYRYHTPCCRRIFAFEYPEKQNRLRKFTFHHIVPYLADIFPEFLYWRLSQLRKGIANFRLLALQIPDFSGVITWTTSSIKEWVQPRPENNIFFIRTAKLLQRSVW